MWGEKQMKRHACKLVRIHYYHCCSRWETLLMIVHHKNWACSKSSSLHLSLRVVEWNLNLWQRWVLVTFICIRAFWTLKMHPKQWDKKKQGSRETKIPQEFFFFWLLHSQNEQTDRLLITTNLLWDNNKTLNGPLFQQMAPSNYQ